MGRRTQLNFGIIKTLYQKDKTQKWILSFGPKHQYWYYEYQESKDNRCLKNLDELAKDPKLNTLLTQVAATENILNHKDFKSPFKRIIRRATLTIPLVIWKLLFWKLEFAVRSLSRAVIWTTTLFHSAFCLPRNILAAVTSNRRILYFS